MKKEFEYNDVVMTDEELAEIVGNAMEQLSAETIIDTISEICMESEKEEPGKFKESPPIVKIAYIAHEMYKRGFALATYLMNESFKEAFVGSGSIERKAGDSNVTNQII